MRSIIVRGDYWRLIAGEWRRRRKAAQTRKRTRALDPFVCVCAFV